MRCLRPYSDLFFVVVLLFVGGALLSIQSAYGKGGGSGALGNALPSGVIFPTPVGILFPGFNIAAGVNPSVLPMGKKVTAFQAAFAPSLQSGDPQSYLASIATNSQKIGWSVGYIGAAGGGTSTHGIFAGFGYKLGMASLGIGLRDSDISGGVVPNVDIGLTLKMGSEFHLGFVGYNLDSSAQVATGFGFGRPNKDNVELNVLTPAASNSGVGYTVTIAATVYSGMFGTTFRTSYLTGSRAFSHTLGGLLWIFSDFNIILQLTTPRTLTFGITYVF